MPDRRETTTDHDLLIKLGEQIKQVRIDIKELSENTSAKVLDHELRLRRLELWGAMAIGGLSLIQFLGFGYLLTILK
jgi:hypothetical protein